METQNKFYAIVIGAGRAGIEIATGLAKAGKKVLVIDKGPSSCETASYTALASKALIASSTIAHEVWRSSLFGIDMRISAFQSNRVLGRVREVLDAVESRNNPQALRSLGVQTFYGKASFLDPYTVQVIDYSNAKSTFSAKNIIIATGSCPIIPSIKGLDEVSYYTKETIFSLSEIPASLAIIGGGETGCELAQAFKRLGSTVILIEQADYLLKNEEPEVCKSVQSALVKEGVEIYLGHQVTRISKENEKIGINVKHKSDEKEYELHVQQLLIATGQRPKFCDLDLDKAEVAYNDDGILFDAYGRTNIGHIWVAQDASGRAYFTHAAINQAHTVLKNILLPWPFRSKIDVKQQIPRVIFTDPEVASIGLTEEQAIEQYGAHSIATVTIPLSESDMALCQARTDGFVKIVTKRLSSRILGASIVAPIAADMLLEVSYAMKYGLPLRKLSDIIHPYPTYSQIVYKAAYKWFSDTILPFVKKIFGR